MGMMPRPHRCPRAGMRWGPPGLAAVGLVLALAGGAAGAVSPRPEGDGPAPAWMWRGPDTTLDVFHYGAEGDGVTDDTLAFQVRTPGGRAGVGYRYGEL